MVGGKVIKTETKNDMVIAEVVDPKILDDRKEVRIKLTDESNCIRKNDSLWWYDDKVFWTPKDGKAKDIELQKIGNVCTI